MMKASRYILLFAVAALSIMGCKKNYLPISDHPFDISTPKVEANRVVIDIIPDNNDFYYMFGIVDAGMFDEIGTEFFVNFTDNLLKTSYKALFDTESLDKFPEWLYRGAYDEVNHDLNPGTKYYVYAYPYDGEYPLMDKFTKIEITTPAIVKSDNKFSVSVDGSVISVTPSNGDSYFFDYCNEEELADYYMSIDYFFRKTIDIYWEFGFLDGYISKGPDSEDIKDYYKNLADGDIFYLGISGYDQGITTDVDYYKITVHQGGSAKSTIERVPDMSKSQLPSSVKACNSFDSKEHPGMLTFRK